MSVQFGRWNFDGQPVDPEYLTKVNELLSPYAPDSCSSHSAPGSAILYHAFYTTKESRRERQPHISSSGVLITWDGRLDNRSQLIRELDDRLTASSTDIEIVAAAYDEWGERSFAKLIGDWALAIWNSAARCLILAKDPIGTRHLYYTTEESRITWSTILDPLVLLAGHKFQLCEEYIAGWLGFFPATHLTPYLGIDSVPPSSFVRLQPGKREIHQYWDFDPHKRIRYRTDAEYEEHFRTVFAEAVRRRLRSDRPVLAELSGGMDSSSIVCMADEIIARGGAETPRLDTVSYYDDSEPNWNERPFFAKVEERRGRTGCHIDVGGQGPLDFPRLNARFLSTPAQLGSGKASEQMGAWIADCGTRVLLSGIGGDEVTGGVPTPIPHLADLLTRGRLRALTRELKAWALAKRKPWIYLLFEVANRFVPLSRVNSDRNHSLPPWLDATFAKMNEAALRGYEKRLRLIGPLPSFQENLAALENLRRQFGCVVSVSPVLHEKRYPYVDCDLLAFLYAVPREQLIRPGRRRHLMRRALGGIVPAEILERKRKAFVSRWPVKGIASRLPELTELTGRTTGDAFGIFSPEGLVRAVEQSQIGEKLNIASLMRTIGVRVWFDSVRSVLLDRPCDHGGAAREQIEAQLFRESPSTFESIEGRG